IGTDLAARSPLSLGGLGQALAKGGDRAGANEILNELVSKPMTSALALTWVHAGLGNVEEALDSLERAIENREPHIVLVPLHSGLAPLRADDRYWRLMDRVGLRPLRKVQAE